MVIIDLILILLILKKGNNTLMIITDKFSKRVMIIPGKDTYTASD